MSTAIPAPINVGQTNTVTLRSTTKSIEIVNMSHVSVSVTGDTEGLMFVLPPFNTKQLMVNGGQSVTFQTAQSVIATPAQQNEYINFFESTISEESPLTPLAMLPIYTTQVSITGENQVSFANGTTVDANIQGTPTFQFAPGSTIDVGSVANMPELVIQDGTIGLASGSELKVNNAVIQTSNLVPCGSVKVNVPAGLGSTSQAGNAVFTVPSGYYDSAIAVIQSTKGQSYTVTIQGCSPTFQGVPLTGYTPIQNECTHSGEISVNLYENGQSMPCDGMSVPIIYDDYNPNPSVAETVTVSLWVYRTIQGSLVQPNTSAKALYDSLASGNPWSYEQVPYQETILTPSNVTATQETSTILLPGFASGHKGFYLFVNITNVGSGTPSGILPRLLWVSPSGHDIVIAAATWGIKAVGYYAYLFYPTDMVSAMNNVIVPEPVTESTNLNVGNKYVEPSVTVGNWNPHLQEIINAVLPYQFKIQMLHIDSVPYTYNVDICTLR